jgi:hypothetical protein
MVGQLVVDRKFIQHDMSTRAHNQETVPARLSAPMQKYELGLEIEPLIRATNSRRIDLRITANQTCLLFLYGRVLMGWISDIQLREVF